eukprot:89164-Pleurochrysis_carterae.AAC.2
MLCRITATRRAGPLAPLPCPRKFSRPTLTCPSRAGSTLTGTSRTSLRASDEAIVLVLFNACALE